MWFRWYIYFILGMPFCSNSLQVRNGSTTICKSAANLFKCFNYLLLRMSIVMLLLLLGSKTIWIRRGFMILLINYTIFRYLCLDNFHWFGAFHIVNSYDILRYLYDNTISYLCHCSTTRSRGRRHFTLSRSEGRTFLVASCHCYRLFRGCTARSLKAIKHILAKLFYRQNTFWWDCSKDMTF